MKPDRPYPAGARTDLPGEVEVWFDGGCPLCRREIALMQRLDRAGRIRFTELTRLHARENGVMLSGAAAFAAMWRCIPLLRPLSLAARLPAIEALLEWLYARFLRIRPRLQALLR